MAPAPAVPTPLSSPIRVMPFEALAKLNEKDLEALHLFLENLPARQAGGR